MQTTEKTQTAPAPVAESHLQQYRRHWAEIAAALSAKVVARLAARVLGKRKQAGDSHIVKQCPSGGRIERELPVRTAFDKVFDGRYAELNLRDKDWLHKYANVPIHRRLSDGRCRALDVHVGWACVDHQDLPQVMACRWYVNQHTCSHSKVNS